MKIVSIPDSKLFAAAFEGTNVGMLIHDEEKIVLEYNNAMEKITGFSREEMIGQDCRSLFDRAFHGNSCAFCDAIENKSGITNFETPINRGDGKSCTLVRLDSFPFYDHDKLFFLITIKDVTKMHLLKGQDERLARFPNIVGKSVALKSAFEFVHTLAETDITVLIVGATGTGKELAASAIHHHGRRRKGPFIVVNCAGLSESLIESELFGHVKGAFTGATRDRIGRFEAASGGTIFLDEIGEVSLHFQAKLLRVLQEKEIERVGEQKLRKVDVRVVAATNKDLKVEMRANRFRKDLYYRLAGAMVHMPLLKERKEDIPILVSHFILKFSVKYNREITGVSDDLMRAMMNYHWPGNIRELYNLMENSVITTDGKIIEMSSVAAGFFDRWMDDDDNHTFEMKDPQKYLSQGLSERDRIKAALESSRYVISDCAKLLGISRTTLWRRMKTLNVK